MGGRPPEPRPGGSLAGPGPGAAGRGGKTETADEEAAREPGRGRVIKGEVPGPRPPLPLRPPPPSSFPPSAAAPAAAAACLPPARRPRRVTARGPSSAFGGGAPRSTPGFGARLAARRLEAPRERPRVRGGENGPPPPPPRAPADPPLIWQATAARGRSDIEGGASCISLQPLTTSPLQTSSPPLFNLHPPPKSSTNGS
ncbi:WAS/WASL-interacting protein family member 1-like [Cervus elaphus]|uniref:WAS/WASL-interacting protein family member 1-like n=1 Tax=Cervus canadensis TaxID=1574408 RepID=UPI001C9E6A11|nr:WAS/WASL-interacting protein family member 1-like [Cervus canadensis]XP_043773102.1 WAS/WASL-interacting protein family member 1-like [Cervus elaphus]